MHLRVLIVGRNCSPWVKQCLDSVLKQTYSDVSIHVTDDCSTDDTAQILATYQDARLRVTLNEQRKYATANLRTMAKEAPIGSVLVLVDMDDWLPHENVLARVAREYVDSECWLTYGSFDTYPQPGLFRHWRSYPANANYRRHEWLGTHLRTFRRELFLAVRDEDLLWKGEPAGVTWDLAIMLPMLEMATDRHAHFIPDTLYIYNMSNPSSDFVARAQEQKEAERHFRALAPYPALQYLYSS